MYSASNKKLIGFIKLYLKKLIILVLRGLLLLFDSNVILII